MRRIGRGLLAAALLAFTAGPVAADVVLGSWNIARLGHGEQKRFDKLAHVISHKDFVAIQEVMDETAIDRLERKLEAVTGESWSSMTSHLIGRGSYREAYSFMYRDSAVEYLDGAVVFFDTQDVFAREPYSARFRSKRSGREWAAANIHVIYGDRVADRVAEVEALEDYWLWLQEVYPDTPLVLMGDFNLDSRHDAWGRLRALEATAVVDDGATTLSPTDGRYANAYDHIWIEPGSLPVSGSGVIRFPALFDIDHQAARRTVSDHAPVWMSLGDAQLALTPFESVVMDTRALAANDPNYHCVDINQSPGAMLERLPHIGEVRAGQIKAGRPWDSLEGLVQIRGIAAGQVAAMRASGLLCE